MKKLVLIRHAKSDWSQSVDDIDRPLKEKGRQRAKELSKSIQQFLDLKLYHWYSSPALRAFSTAEIFQKEIGNVSFETIDTLYTFSAHEVLRIVNTLMQNHNGIALFGHNPAFTDFANQFGDYRFDNLPTSGIVAIDIHFQNQSVQPKGHTRLLLTHKEVYNG